MSGAVRVGDVLADRFEVEDLAGQGGMGAVFRARDRLLGGLVAVKVLQPGHLTERFDREARLLAQLRHPGIVRYLGHGKSPSGEPFLVMEWLEGVDLEAFLRRGSQPPAPIALAIVRQVADALAVAHEAGVIHRDIKPRNLFLVDGDPGRVRLLDFGIARSIDSSKLTGTDVVVGTPGYMSPEQARGDLPLDPRSDVFALGCVLVECLTLRTPSARGARPGVGPAIDGLVQRMLAPDRNQRLANGAAVARAIDELPHDVSGGGGLAAVALTTDERRITAVIVLGGALRRDETVPSSQRPSLAVVQAVARHHDATCERLSDGSLAVVFAGGATATDLAARAARCAVALRASLPRVTLHLATGWGPAHALAASADADGRWQVDPTPPGRLREDDAPITMDELTARLLGGRIEMSEPGLARAATPALVEQPAPFVGRDWELESLASMFRETVLRPGARIALVTAVPGLGKSRLASELIAKVRRAYPAAAIWLGRGDALRAGAAFGLLADVLRDALQLETRPVSEQWARLRRGLGDLDMGAEGSGADLFAELLAIPAADDRAGVESRTVRREPGEISEQIRRTWLGFIGVETSRRPVLIVLEDLHWGDLPTVRMIDAAVAEHGERPLMILALARAEVHESFPQLWKGRPLSELQLLGLSRAESERLVRSARPSLGAEVVADLVARAGGHPFYLKELVRAASEHGRAGLPDTVVAMAQTVVERLDPRARRILRAASVLGETFSAAGVSRLLGDAGPETHVADWLETLVELELLVKRGDGRAGRPELVFRHALLQEAAYAMLTEADRRSGHQLAGEWLEQGGDADHRTLAEHFERGTDRARAAPHFLHAAEWSAEGGDAAAALALARRGLACAETEESRVALLALCCEQHMWRLEMAEASRYADLILERVPRDRLSLRVLGLVLACDSCMDRDEQVSEACERIAQVRPTADTLRDYVVLGNAGILCRVNRDARRETLDLMARLEEASGPLVVTGSVADVGMGWSRVMVELGVNEDPWTASIEAGRVRAISIRLANRPLTAVSAVLHGLSLWLLGCVTEAEPLLRESAQWGMALAYPSLLCAVALCGLLLDRGDYQAVLATATRMIDDGRAYRLEYHEGAGRLARAIALLHLGRSAEAEDAVLQAIEQLGRARGHLAVARATLARALLQRGAAEAALREGREALALYERHGILGFRASVVPLALAEAQRAAGDRDGARATICAARDRLQHVAVRIDDAHMKRGFLEVADHALIFAGARAD